MIIRKTTERDVGKVLPLYDAARRYMRAEGNMAQWSESYPSDKSLRADMAEQGSYVCEADDGHLCATFFLRIGTEPTYSAIYDGTWLNDKPYGVIHRIASDGTERGVLHKILDFCFLRIDNIRIDTHRSNKTMRRNLTTYGFRYCGIIHLANGDERLAYQLERTKKTL